MSAGMQVRDMTEADLGRAIELDAAAGGMRRGDFFRKRWRAMQGAPEDYIAIVAHHGDDVDGYIMAHLLSGEFGTDERFAVLDGLAVDASRQHAGTGTALVEALKEAARDRDCVELRTQIAWPQQDLLAFFAGCGFTPAAVNVLERDLASE